VGCLVAMVLIMLHVHAGDVAYISHVHRPIILIPAGASTSVGIRSILGLCRRWKGPDGRRSRVSPCGRCQRSAASAQR
jgi:hypothetical protein